jgi:hypothetical protein
VRLPPILIAFTFPLLLLVLTAKGDPAPKEKITIINKLINTGGEKDLATAAAEIGNLLDNYQIPSPLISFWLPTLAAKGRQTDVADIALRTALLQPDTRTISYMMVLRTNAFSSLGKPEDALVASKMAFNVCTLGETDKAVGRMRSVIALARPDDKGIGQRLTSEVSGEVKDATVLKSIKIDPSIVASAMSRFQGSTKFGDKIKYGNLLLLADRGGEAENYFRGLYNETSVASDKAQAGEGVARAMRAVDGSLTRANEWLKTLGGG